jgi:ribosome-binding factor A
MVATPMSVHHEQAASILRRAIQEVLARGLSDPRVRGLVSVTRVELSPDHANATVYVSVMPAEQGAVAIHGIRHAARHVRSQVGRRVAFRRVPQLSFRLDESLKRQAEMLSELGRLERERAESEQPPTSGKDDTP